MLRKRLINQLSASESYEEILISEFKKKCGYEYTSKLEQVIKDIHLSEDLTKQYRTYEKNTHGNEIMIAAVNERQMIIQAALVREMKRERTLKHSLLIREVIQQLASSFKPDISLIKFELLAALCSISNDIVSKALLDIQNNQLVTVELLEEDDLQSQVEAMVQLVQATAYAQLTSFLRFVQMIYRSNTLVSALGTNAVAQIGLGTVLFSPTYYVYPYIFYVDPSYALSCTEKIMVTPAVFYAQPLDTSISDHTYWPTYHFVSSYSIISASVDGFFGGCFPLDSILNSTLDCLYNFQCVELLFDYFPALNQVQYI
ncbi:unnamed protein product [Adineta steineri]|uniref:Cullin family profile domain-containing protein n=1 Tax=Adineta steineri TaxID=433720 RepID=A0A815CLD4_9BILA|nr:unnamed protein product [Adineta steineri]